MGIPNSRATLVEYCLRQLGWPVIKINLDDDQIDDRVDEALQFFQEYHYDATEKIFMRHKISAQDIANKYIDLTQASGVVSIANGSTTVVGSSTEFSSEFIAGVSIIEVAGETRTVSSVSNSTHMIVDSAFTSTQTDVPIKSITGPDSLIGVTRIFPVGGAFGRMSMFNLQYQIRLNDLWALTAVSVSGYSITMSHLELLNQMFVGETTLRFNRHQSRLYIDMDWDTKVTPGEFIIIEGYKIIDPNSYTAVYNDRWLKKYTTALLKKQWGNNLKKFMGVKLPGGIMLNGQGIYDEAVTEIGEIEDEMQMNFELPPRFFVG